MSDMNPWPGPRRPGRERLPDSSARRAAFLRAIREYDLQRQSTQPSWDDALEITKDLGEPPSALPAPPVIGRRLLIVEDHEATRTVLQKIFERRRWHVFTAGTVAEALERLDDRPHAIILDLMLPDGGGEIVLCKVRCEGLSARVVITSGSGEPDRLQAVAQLWPDAVLRKPVRLDQVVRALEQAVEC